MRELGKLLCDGACAFGKRTALQVTAQCSEDTVNINSAMLIKSNVFCGNESLLCMQGDIVDGYKRSVFTSLECGDDVFLPVVQR